MRTLYAFAGAALVVAGVAAQVIAQRHHPVFFTGGPYLVGPDSGPARTIGWSTTTYDVVRVAGFALIVFGAVIVALALIREFRKAV